MKDNSRRIDELIFNRRSDSEIGRVLGLSEAVVKKRRTELYRSLGATTLAEAVVEADRRGMLRWSLPAGAIKHDE